MSSRPSGVGGAGSELPLLVLGDIVTSHTVLRGGGMVVADGKVVDVLDPRDCALHGEWRSVLDYSERMIFPGIVDAHVHSFSGPGEGWERSTRAAATGGVTTIVEMPYDADAPIVDVELFEAKRARIAGRSAVDIALLATIKKQDGISAVEGLIKAGACGFKVSLFETDPVRFPRISSDVLLQLMNVCAEHQMVVGFHAEDTEIVAALTRRLRVTAPTDPMSHGRSRPPLAENLATALALELGHGVGCPVHIYHASQARAVDLVNEFVRAGADATVETCPHYLFLDEGDMLELGARGKINPPLRARQDRDALWERLSSGAITMITSDHAPWNASRKSSEVIFDNASGVPGVDVLGPLILGLGYLGGRLSALEVARLLSRSPARRFGLSCKGEIAKGMDADWFVFNTRGDRLVSGATSYSGAGWSPYETMRIPGRIEATYLRGMKVFDGDKACGSLSAGRFVPCDQRVGAP